MSVCQHCKAEFTDPEWPATRKIYCSGKCNQAAWRLRQGDALKQQQAQYQKDHRDRVNETKRKYNATEKNQAAQRRYRVYSDISGQYLEKYRTDPEVRRIQRSREISRKKLFKATAGEVKCAGCELEPPHKIQCHHIDRNPHNTHLDNLMWLCTSCHSEVHDFIDSL